MDWYEATGWALGGAGATIGIVGIVEVLTGTAITNPEEFVEGGKKILDAIKSFADNIVEGVKTLVDDVVELTGQDHHVFANPVMDVIKQIPELAEKIGRNDLIVQARDLASHIGYQGWHREVDSNTITMLTSTTDLSPKIFGEYIIKVYSSSDMIYRFPNALQIIRDYFDHMK